MTADQLIEQGLDDDLTTLVDANLALSVSSKTDALVEVRTHTIKLTYDADMTELTTTAADYLSGGVGEWYMLQFHFHHPSEHTVDGVAYDLEIHFVNLNAEGTQGLVLGVFFDSSSDVADPLLD